MSKRSTRADFVLSGVLVLTALLMFLAMREPSVDRVLKLQFARNGVPIEQLDQPRAINATREIWIDRLDLAHGGRLAHPVLGELGFGRQFFVDLETRIEMLEARTVQFEIESDDGFALELDDRRICAYVGHRGLAAQRCRVLLEAGVHSLKLSYFQAGGPAGLRVRIAESEGGAWRLLGEEGEVLRVLR